MEVSSICTPSGGIAFGLSVLLIQLTHAFPKSRTELGPDMWMQIPMVEPKQQTQFLGD